MNLSRHAKVPSLMCDQFYHLLYVVAISKDFLKLKTVYGLCSLSTKYMKKRTFLTLTFRTMI